MAKSETRVPQSAPPGGQVKAPSVLVVLVVSDGARWLRQCLLALSRQTHPRLGVLAVDNGSQDDSVEVLESALGERRVIRLERDVGFSEAIRHVLRSEASADADYVLLLHDDAILTPGAITGLVEAAMRIDGVGVVGPKVLDWDDPRRLREIGLSTDRFGYAYSPLEEGEVDQGQYDRIREVMFVSSCAMLVSRQVLNRVGLPDERLPSSQGDLDFCWRARIAGFRVLMTPQATAHHRAASAADEDPGASGSVRERYERERAALTSIVKNYSFLTLLWILPLYLLQGTARIVALALSRRFEDAYQVLAAWGWNLAHLPGTIGRRVRAQSVRSVPDRQVRRTMAPAGIRLRRWASAAGRTLLPAREPAEEAVRVPGWLRVGRFAAAHPVLTAWTMATIVALFAYRHMAGASPLTGGRLNAFPSDPTDFFRELVSGLRHTGLGGTGAGSPALGFLGLGSIVALGSPALLQKVVVLTLPAAAAVGVYRSVRSLTGDRVSSTVAAASYGLSSTVLWAVSQGAIPVLIFLAGLPWLAGKVANSFSHDLRVRPLRWVVGTALGLAALASFFPAVALAAGILLLSALATSPSSVRLRATGLLAVAAGLAGVLIFPLTSELVRAGGSSMVDFAGRPSFEALVHGALGRAPGAWAVGLFLPIAAAIGLVFVSRRLSAPAVRAALAAIPSVYLAWLATAGYLPPAVSNPVAYAGVATLSFALLVGMGLASVLPGMTRESFGPRQLGGAVMTLVLAVGLVGQAAQAGKGSWTIGGSEKVPPAYPLAGGASGPPYRVLWLGEPGGDAFLAPGGEPDGIVAAGDASVRFAVTGRHGASALDIGRPAYGPGYGYLHRALTEILAGETRHGGALLAPVAVRFVVASPGDLPRKASARLQAQLDLNRISVAAGGLAIYENPDAVPVASEIAGAEWERAAAAQRIDLAAISALPPPESRPLEETPDGFALGTPPVESPRPSSRVAYVAEQFSSDWVLTPSTGGPERSAQRTFGWAMRFELPSQPGDVSIRFTGQTVRTIETALLAILWLAALWITRRPVRRG
jgi:GT2 family glycosyltransferase